MKDVYGISHCFFVCRYVSVLSVSLMRLTFIRFHRFLCAIIYKLSIHPAFALPMR